MRTLAITVIVTLAATTALPGKAQAICLADDLACSVHGGSGMVLEQGRFTPRARSGNFYLEQTVRGATSPRQVERYRRGAPEAETWPDTNWDRFSDWQELGEPGQDLRQTGPRASGSSDELDPDDETLSEMADELEVNPRLQTRRAVRQAPQAPARAGRLPARGPTGIADSPQRAATSFFKNR